MQRRLHCLSPQLCPGFGNEVGISFQSWLSQIYSQWTMKCWSRGVLFRFHRHRHLYYFVSHITFVLRGTFSHEPFGNCIFKWELSMPKYHFFLNVNDWKYHRWLCLKWEHQAQELIGVMAEMCSPRGLCDVEITKLETWCVWRRMWCSNNACL